MPEPEGTLLDREQLERVVRATVGPISQPKVVHVRPGDRVVVTVEKTLTEAAFKRLDEQIQKHFPAPEICSQVVVLERHNGEVLYGVEVSKDLCASEPDAGGDDE